VLPHQAQFWCSAVVHLLSIVFALSLLAGGYQMGLSTYASTIPTLGLSEAYRYLPVVSAGVLITLFSTEHIVALFKSEKVIPSWH
jgi:TRAP-type C4-dicarboxylate transport system permease small subunit